MIIATFSFFIFIYYIFYVMILLLLSLSVMLILFLLFSACFDLFCQYHSFAIIFVRMLSIYYIIFLGPFGSLPADLASIIFLGSLGVGLQRWFDQLLSYGLIEIYLSLTHHSWVLHTTHS